MSDYDWTTAMRVRLETERDGLRAQLEDVTRERDEARVELEKFRALGGGHAAFAYANVAASVERAESCVSDDEARQLRGRIAAREAEVVRLREALELINAVVVWSDTSREWHLMPRLRTMPALEKVRAALASTPSDEP